VGGILAASGVPRGANGGQNDVVNQLRRVAERPVFLYDGDCAFCTRCAQFVERRIPTRAVVLPWQWVELGPLGVTEDEAEAAVQWIDEDGGVSAGPVAISHLLVDGGPWWRPLGWLLRIAPVRWAAWPVYRLVARNRHRLPGGTAACSLPQAERDAARDAASGAPAGR
jgi:predicted DCC family thiol-disulfide oxidoreductase YuxK